MHCKFLLQGGGEEIIIFISFRFGNLINEKQINSFLSPSPVQKCHGVRSFSEASTVDPVVLLEMFSQTKNSQLPKDCFAESRNLFFFNIALMPNEPAFKNIRLEHVQISRSCLPAHPRVDIYL